MKKLFGFTGVAAVSILLLTACGSPYDDEIDEVIKEENDELDDPAVKTDIDTLEREDSKIWVYEDGEYIELEYNIRGKRETATPVYKYNNQEEIYEDYTKGDFNKSDIDGLEADYTENVDDDS